MPTRLHAVRWLAMFAAALLLMQGGATAMAQQARALRDGVELANLRFVGADEGLAPATALGQTDVAILVAARRPITLNELIAGGIPVRAQSIRRLIDLGLLRQEGMEMPTHSGAGSRF